MPRRYLAPWQRRAGETQSGGAGGGAEQIAAAEAALQGLAGRPALYHCVSRVVDRQFLLGSVEKEHFVELMRAYEAFCEVRILAFAVLSNHFHLLVEVPEAPPERGRDWSDSRFLEHLATLYTRREVGKVRWRLEQFRGLGADAEAEALRESYLRRLWDLSAFMKGLKQRFSRWFNARHARHGTLWEERFKSVLVQDGHAARTVAAYIELNAVRAGILADPRHYRWCSYGEAAAGNPRARAAIQRLLSEAPLQPGGARSASPKPPGWRRAGPRYRSLLEAALGARATPPPNPQGASAPPALSEARALNGRVRHFLDGLVLGSESFVQDLFVITRERFGPHRRDGPRPLRGIQSSLRAMRDLRKTPTA